MKIVKKTLTVLILLVLFGSNYLQAQCTCTESPGSLRATQLVLCENFESYTNGSSFPFNNSRWTFWPGTGTFGRVQTAPSSNSKALLVQHNGFSSPNLLLKLGNRTSGRYRVSWQMYIAKGKTAYYSIQHAESAELWAYDVDFENGIGTLSRFGLPVTKFPYIIGGWNKVMQIIDITADKVELWINDEYVDSWRYNSGRGDGFSYNWGEYPLAAINFTGAPNASYYIDNICMWQATPALPSNVGPTCIKNGQSISGGESIIKNYNLYTEREYSSENCRNICSFAGLNVKNSLKYDNKDRVPASRIDDASILPNQVINLSCIKDLFPFRPLTLKQLRGQIYPFTATTTDLSIELQFQVGSEDAVRIALVECNENLNFPCRLDENTDGLSYYFNVQPGKTYNIIVIAYETVEFLIDISTVIQPKICVLVNQDKGTPCICKEATTTLSQSTTLNNVSVPERSETERVFPNEINKVYSGGEKAFRITLDQPSLVNFTLSSANQGYIMFLAGSDCTDNLLALNSTPDNGGTATIPKALEAGVYHLIVDQLRANPNSRFNLTYTVSALAPVSRASNSACPINPNNAHQVTIRSSPLLLDGSALTPSDRIYLVNPRNKDNRESNAANWNGVQLNFTLYEDSFNDKESCGYVEGEVIEFVIVRQDKIFNVRPIFQLETGVDITAGDRFKKGGKSLITGFVSNLNISNLGLASSIPTLTANANNFPGAIISNENESWRIERTNPNKPSWITVSPQEGSGVTDISFQIPANPRTQTRVDTLLLINDQGFYKSIIITQPGCTGPSVKAEAVQPICPGRNAKLTASGVGTITWQNPGSIPNPSFITPTLNATQTFTAYATLGGCTASDQVTVNVLPKPNANAGTDRSIICRGDSTTLQASGGGTYLWSNGKTSPSIKVSPTSDQVYQVTITDNNCPATASVKVTVNPLPSANAGPDQPICSGAEAFLNASGEGTYTWSGGATTTQLKVSPTTTTTYTLTVTSQSGCKATDQVVVVVNRASANAGTDRSSICRGDSTTLQASGGGTYLWSNGKTSPSIKVSPTSDQVYQVTVTDNNCPGTASVKVNVNPLPSANAGPDQPICSGSEAVLNASGVGTYTWSDGSTTTQLKVSPTTTTTYTLTVTSQSGCKATDQVVVVVNRASAIAGTDRSSICRGDSTTLQASGGGTYLWSNGKTSPSIKVSPTSDQVYQVTVTDNNCPATATVKVIVNPLPTANAGPDQPICSGAEVILSASGDGTYSWSGGATTTQLNVRPTTTTTYTLTVTSQSGCKATDQVVVVVNRASANAGTDRGSICRGDSTTLQASGGGTYLWSNGKTSPSIKVSPTSDQVYQVTVTDNNCPATATVKITVNQLPLANAGSDQPICSGAEAVLNASGDGTYTWSGGATTTQLKVSPTTTTTYTLTVTSQSGCKATDQVVVVVNRASANAGTDRGSICRGDSTTLQASGGGTYLWSNGKTSPSIKVSPTSDQVYQVTVTDNNCPAIATVKVTVNPLPLANAGPDQPICSGSKAVLSASGVGTYTWSNGSTAAQLEVNPTVTTSYTLTVTSQGCTATDQVVVVVNRTSASAGTDRSICRGDSTTLQASGGGTYLWSTGKTSPSFKVSPTSDQVYQVTVTDNNCPATASVKVTVNPLPLANAGADTSICAGQSARLTASGGSTYKWSNSTQTPTITVTPASTETFTVTVTAQNGCAASDQLTVTVRPRPMADAGPDQSICTGESARLNASGGSSYKWSNNTQIPIITVTPVNTTTFTVTVTENGCDATDQLTVTVRPLPVANAGPDQSICAGKSAVLTASGGSSYKWSNNATTASITISPIGTQIFSVKVTQNGCEASDEVLLTVKPLPSANAGPDLSICAGQDAVLNASGGSNYKWSNNVSTASITIRPIATQIFTVTVTQEDCMASDEMLLTVKPLPIANAGPDQSICVGQSAALNATGGSSYKWNTNAITSAITINPTTTQTYSVTVTQNECEAVDRVTITVNPNPSIKKDSSQFKAGLKSFIAVSVTGGKSPYQFQWFHNDTLTSTQEDLVGLKTGIYKLTVKDANGCSAGYGPELFLITSARDVVGLLDLKIYPNPTQGQFRIEGRLKKQETVQVCLLDVNGKYIWKSDAKNADHFLYTPNLFNLAPGIYIIQLDVSGDLVYRKLVLQ